MRVGLLVNSSVEGLRLRELLEPSAERIIYVLIFRKPREQWHWFFFRVIAGIFLKPGRLQRLRALARGRIKILNHRLSHKASHQKIRNAKLDFGIHKSENIYTGGTIRCFKEGILNAHIGSLPEYRGRSVFEWAILNGDEPAITTFFVDEGIDTGERVVNLEAANLKGVKSLADAKNTLFQETMVGQYKKALDILQGGNPKQVPLNGTDRRYYAMSKLFTNVVEERLTRLNEPDSR